MKKVLVICDGMADEPVDVLDGKTPLEVAGTPVADNLAKEGICGSLQTVPDSHYAGSETAIMSILGYRPEELPDGRGPLEALGLGVWTDARHTVMRYEITDKISAEKSGLFRRSDLSFYPISDISGICIAPNPLKNGEEPGFRFWSGDTPRQYTRFFEKHGYNGNSGKGVIIGAVPLLKGIATAVGFDWIRPEGCDGTVRTNYKAKAAAAVRQLESYDVVTVHVEACDMASHARDPESKIAAIEKIDRDILLPLAEHSAMNPGLFSIAVMSDHPSLCSSGKHSRGNSPFLLYHTGIEADSVDFFNERAVEKGRLTDISQLWETNE